MITITPRRDAGEYELTFSAPDRPSWKPYTVIARDLLEVHWAINHHFLALGHDRDSDAHNCPLCRREDELNAVCRACGHLAAGGPHTCPPPEDTAARAGLVEAAARAEELFDVDELEAHAAAQADTRVSPPPAGRLVAFLYWLLREHVTVGEVELVLNDALAGTPALSNRHLAAYAEEVAAALTAPPGEDGRAKT